MSQQTNTQEHLFDVILHKYKEGHWRNSPQIAESLCKLREIAVPLLRNISYSSLSKEFSDNKNDMKVFLAFINREYKEVRKVYDASYAKLTQQWQ